jgi:hypothetical protein
MRATPEVAPKDGELYLFWAAANAGRFGIDGDVPEQMLEGRYFGPGRDWIMKGGVVEGVQTFSNGREREGVWVTLKVWRPDEEEPAEPQLKVFDSSPHSPETPGVIGVGAWTKLGNVQIDATFDDIQFIPVPEPSSLLLAFIGIAGLLPSRRHQKSAACPGAQC